MRNLRAIGRQRLVVIFPRRVGVEREVELVFPPELEPRAAQRIVANCALGCPFARSAACAAIL
jgi:hypothetical protein